MKVPDTLAVACPDNICEAGERFQGYDPSSGYALCSDADEFCPANPLSDPVRDVVAPSCDIRLSAQNGAVLATAQCREVCDCGDSRFNSGCKPDQIKTYLFTRNGSYDGFGSMEDEQGNAADCPAVEVDWIMEGGGEAAAELTDAMTGIQEQQAAVPPTQQLPPQSGEDINATVRIGSNTYNFYLPNRPPGTGADIASLWQSITQNWPGASVDLSVIQPDGTVRNYKVENGQIWATNSDSCSYPCKTNENHHGNDSNGNPICSAVPDCPETNEQSNESCGWEGKPKHPFWRNAAGHIMKVEWPIGLREGDRSGRCDGIRYRYGGGFHLCLSAITTHDDTCNFSWTRRLEYWDSNAGGDSDGDGNPDGACAIRNLASGRCNSIPVKIDEGKPGCNVFYTPQTWTNGNVTVTGICREPCNCGDPRYNSGCSPGSGGSRTVGSNGGGSFSVSDVVGNSGSCSYNVGWIDKEPPSIISQPQSFVAEHEKNIVLSFRDTGGSGLLSVSVRIRDSFGRWRSYGTSYPFAVYSDPGQNNGTLTFTHNFADAGRYHLWYRVCDIAGSCTSDTIRNFFRVAPNEPVFNVWECWSRYLEGRTCPSVFSYTPDPYDPADPIIADGEEHHSINLDLHDKYGNELHNWATIVFNFANQTALDQISLPLRRGTEGDGTNDSSRYRTRRALTNGNPDKNPGGDAANLVHLRNGRDPYVRVSSYAPTSTGYDAIRDDEFSLGLSSVDWTYNPTGYRYYGLGRGNHQEARDFPFYPALTVTPEVLNFNPDDPDADDNGYAVEDPQALENVMINTKKCFRITLTNESDTQRVGGRSQAKDLEFGVILETNDSDVVWEDAQLERIYDNTVLLNHLLNLITISPGNIWNTLTETNLYRLQRSGNNGSIRQFRFCAVPKLAPGEQVPDPVNTEFELRSGYLVNGKHSRHKADPIADPLQTNFNLYNVSIEIVGGVNSTKEVFTPNSNDLSPLPISSISLNELKNAVNRNVAPVLQESFCADQLEISQLTGGGDHFAGASDCFATSREIILVSGNDVILFADNDTNTLTLPNEPRTILIIGGNLHIKSNLVWPTDQGNASFGVIVLKNEAGEGGDILLYGGGAVDDDEGVTNIVGSFYADGSLVSVNSAGMRHEYVGTDCNPDGSQGFCDRASELNNQLYWKGLLVTENTIGGSDADSPFCPTLNGICEWGVGTSEDEKRREARIYDFNYLRSYHPTAGGAAAQDTNSREEAVILQYDGRTQSNPPPLFEGIEVRKGGELYY